VYLPCSGRSHELLVVSAHGARVCVEDARSGCWLPLCVEVAALAGVDLMVPCLAVALTSALRLLDHVLHEVTPDFFTALGCVHLNLKLRVVGSIVEQALLALSILDGCGLVRDLAAEVVRDVQDQSRVRRDLPDRCVFRVGFERSWFCHNLGPIIGGHHWIVPRSALRLFPHVLVGFEFPLRRLPVFLIVLVRMHELVVVLGEEVDAVLPGLGLLYVRELCLRDELSLRVVSALTPEIILSVYFAGVDS